jgi:hypothetical protein
MTPQPQLPQKLGSPALRPSPQDPIIAAMTGWIRAGKLWAIGLVWMGSVAGWATPESLVSRHGRSERSANPGVVGHTYTTQSSGIFRTPFHCGEIVSDLNRLLVEQPLFDQSFVYDYALACVPTDGDQVFVVVDLTVEPAREESTDALENYVLKREGEIVHKQPIHFRAVKKIEVEKTFLAEFLDSHEEATYSYSTTSSKITTFDNFAQYRNHMSNESALFYHSGSIERPRSYINQYLSSQEADLFTARGLEKANHLRISNDRKMTLADGEMIPGAYQDGTFLDCRPWGRSFCLVEP